MPTSDQRDAVRYDLGSVPSAVMADTEIDDLYVRAEAAYPDKAGVQEAWVRWKAVRNLLIQAAKRVDYKQNQSQEWLSQMSVQLAKLETLFRTDLDDALDLALSGSIRFGGLRRSVPRWVEVPQDAPLIASQLTDTSTDVSRLDD